MAWLEIRTSPANSVVQSTNHWATEHVRIAHRLYMFYMKTLSVRMYTFHNCENYVKVTHDCPTKRDGSSFKTLVMQQSSRNIKVSKYKLCPPPFVSRVLLSWQSVDPYLHESNNIYIFQKLMCMLMSFMFASHTNVKWEGVSHVQ